MLRYKACRNSIVTLLLLDDSKTNEKRKYVINDKYAKFRCDRAKVVNIKNVKTGELMEGDLSIYDGGFAYSLEKIVKTYFNENLNEVCASGIHYFKNTKVALSWFYDQNNNFPNGKWTEWHENGHKYSEGTYKDGKKDGKWIYWGVDGKKDSEGTYKDGKHDGKWTGWHKNGQKYSDEVYKDGEYDGKWTTWHDNGHKRAEGTYKDGKHDGKWREWWKNGKKKSKGKWILCEITYKDGNEISKYSRFE